MAYTPTTWTTGDTITASAMNKIENGIAGAGGGGYDAEISIYHSADSSDNYDISIVSGTYASLKEKLLNNEPPLIVAYIWDEMTHYRGATTMTSIYGFPSQQYPTATFAFAVKMPDNSATAHTNWFGILVAWNSEDEVEAW